jgi:hypothetical protein
MTISLEKRVQSVGIQLAKHNITTVPPIRVGLALDISGSAQGLYNDGTIQEAVNRLQAIALKFDDNGELDMWTFSSGGTPFNRLQTATAADYDGYVKRQILENRNISKWNATEYAPVLEDMINFWFPGTTKNSKPLTESKGMFGGLFGKKTAPAPAAAPTAVGLPAMGLLVTDGANQDRSATAAVLKAAVNTNVYWQMIGVGPASYFEFIEEQADLLPNVGFVNLSSLSMSDEQLYAALIAEEFCGWVKNIK